MRTLLRNAMSKSDLVVCARESIIEKYRTYQENALLVQNGVDGRVFKPQDKRIARERSGVNSDDIVVGYFGSIH